jgi:hypothetical protein
MYSRNIVQLYLTSGFLHHIPGRNTMFEAFAMGMVFQAFGLACLFFLFIQAWRHDSKKGTMT